MRDVPLGQMLNLTHYLYLLLIRGDYSLRLLEFKLSNLVIDRPHKLSLQLHLAFLIKVVEDIGIQFYLLLFKELVFIFSYLKHLLLRFIGNSIEILIEIRLNNLFLVDVQFGIY